MFWTSQDVRVLAEMIRSQLVVVVKRPMNLATGVVTPLMFLTILILPRLGQVSPVTATEIASGVLMASLWGASIWSGAGVIRRERWAGTLGVSLTGRASALTVIAGKTIGSVLYDTALILVTTGAFYAATGTRLQIPQPFAVAVGLLAVVVGGVASSLMIGSVLVLSRHAYYLTAALGTPILLLGGTVIPARFLPDWVASAGQVINLSWFQRFMVSTQTSPEWTQLAGGLLVSGVYAWIGHRALRVMLRRAREDGTLELL